MTNQMSKLHAPRLIDSIVVMMKKAHYIARELRDTTELAHATSNPRRDSSRTEHCNETHAVRAN
jgi:hypothetical protein